MKKKNRRAGAMSRGLSAAAAPEPDSECTGGEPRVLFAEPNTDYWIYPSWADYKVKWGELPPLFADPIGTGCVDLLDQQYIESGVIANTVEPFAMLDGPAGGGIIITPIIKPRGLHGSVTNQFAEYSGAHGVGVDSLNREGSSHIAHVGYLKPLRPLYIGERRPKVALRSTTIATRHSSTPIRPRMSDSGSSIMSPANEKSPGWMKFPHWPLDLDLARGDLRSLPRRSQSKRPIGSGKRTISTSGTKSIEAAMGLDTSSPLSSTSHFTCAKLPVVDSIACIWSRSLRLGAVFGFAGRTCIARTNGRGETENQG
jgi:hypothetical protein